MTNEQLAALAQQPENEELVPLLWEKVKPVLWLKAKQAYNARQSVFQQCGVELWDIRQSCYMVFLSALKGYKPETGIKFNSYLSYPFRTLLAEPDRDTLQQAGAAERGCLFGNAGKRISRRKAK